MKMEMRSSEHKSDNVDDATRGFREKVSRVLLFVAVLLACALISCRVATTWHYRALIANAESIDIYYYLQPNPSNKIQVASVSDEDDINRLAQTVEASGLWMPIDVLVAHTWALCLKKDGRVYKIVTVRGGGRIREGVLTTAVNPKTLDYIAELAEKHGQGRPHPTRLSPDDAATRRMLEMHRRGGYGR